MYFYLSTLGHTYLWEWAPANNIIINPQCMVTVVILCVSVTKLAATYLVCKSKLWCYMIPYGVSNACIGWTPPKTLCSLVLVSSADDKLLDFSLSGTQRSIYTKGHVPVLYTVWSAHGRGKVKARSTKWSVCLELAVCKSFSGGKVSSSAVDYIVYASTYSVVYHACLTQRYYTMSMFHCQSLPISRRSWLLLPLAVHAAVNTFMWTTIVLRLSALVLSVSHHSGTHLMSALQCKVS